MFYVQSLCRALHTVLVSAFLDCAPLAFSPTQTCSEAELELVSSVIEIGRNLYGLLLRDTRVVRVRVSKSKQILRLSFYRILHSDKWLKANSVPFLDIWPSTFRLVRTVSSHGI